MTLLETYCIGVIAVGFLSFVNLSSHEEQYIQYDVVMFEL